MRSNVLVTGASGFIGQHVVRRLLARGCIVHGVSRFPMNRDAGGVRWWNANVGDTDRVAEIVSAIRPEIVIHLAGYVSGDRSIDRVLPILRDSLVSTVGLLVSASQVGCQRLVLAGSLEEPDGTQSHQIPVSPYAAAKWAAMSYGRMFHALYAVPTVMARIAMVYGPGQVDERKLVPHVIRSLLRGKSPAVGSGRRALDWVYVDDVADGLVRACFAEQIEGRTIDLGSGQRVTIRDVVNRLVAFSGPSVVPRFGAVPDRPMEQEWSADVDAARALLGWRAVTPLDVGLKRTVDWHKSESAEWSARPMPSRASTRGGLTHRTPDTALTSSIRAPSLGNLPRS